MNILNDFFEEIDVELVKDIDEYNKIIRYSFKRKYSEEFNNNIASDYQINLRNVNKSSQVSD